jgi:hypothetical protein
MIEGKNARTTSSPRSGIDVMQQNENSWRSSKINCRRLTKKESIREELLTRLFSETVQLAARIGVMRALNRHVERVLDPTRKEHHLGAPQVGAGSSLVRIPVVQFLLGSRPRFLMFNR